MNRVIIIGNGFDVAHRLPTRYEDFLAWYFKKGIKESQEKIGEPIENRLITVTSARKDEKNELDKNLDTMENFAQNQVQIHPKPRTNTCFSP